MSMKFFNNYKKEVINQIKGFSSDTTNYAVAILLSNYKDKDGIEKTEVKDMEVIAPDGSRVSALKGLDAEFISELANALGAYESRNIEKYYEFQRTIDHMYRKGEKPLESIVLLFKFSYMQFKLLNCI